jgi:predicted phosphodiesterase
MNLYAISDLHLRHEANRRALEALPEHPDDWLIIAGDVGAGETTLDYALGLLRQRFAKLLWVPGNHDLWSSPKVPGPYGEALYRRLVDICREHGALTPEDPYPVFPAGGRRDGGGGDSGGGGHLIAPLFLLYDYSFRPDHVADHEVLAWAAEEEVMCADEALLRTDPYPSKPAWCAARCEWTEKRLTAAVAAHGGPTVLVNHFPLRREMAKLRRIPRFSPWCGTRRTEDWHLRFRAAAVVYGHLHIRATHARDGVRFEEVSFGYPRDWDPNLGLEPYLRRILPAPDGPGGL